MKFKVLLIGLILALTTSCKDLKDIPGDYDVVMVGNNDYSSYDITMNIEMSTENRISGKSACNSYTGTFQNPKGNEVIMGMFMGTKMYCEDIDAIERDYMDRLGQVTSVQVTDTGLQMLNKENEVIITAVKKEGK